jgi:hypothetical protein
MLEEKTALSPEEQAILEKDKKSILRQEKVNQGRHCLLKSEIDSNLLNFLFVQPSATNLRQKEDF